MAPATRHTMQPSLNGSLRRRIQEPKSRRCSLIGNDSFQRKRRFDHMDSLEGSLICKSAAIGGLRKAGEKKERERERESERENLRKRPHAVLDGLLQATQRPPRNLVSAPPGPMCDDRFLPIQMKQVCNKKQMCMLRNNIAASLCSQSSGKHHRIRFAHLYGNRNCDPL